MTIEGTTTLLVGPERIEQRTYRLPDPGPGEVLLETVRANICGSELHIWRGHHPVVTPGCVLGHEGVGRVARLGAGVDRDFAGRPLAEGDLVTATYFQICRRCPECQRGDWNLCRHGYEYWGTPADVAPHFHGTFGTHWYVHRDQYLFKVPAGVDLRAAASANCALSQMVYSVHVSGATEGDTVLFQGAGGLGLCGIAAARERGARVVVTDVQPGRLDMARAFGAHELVNIGGLSSEAERAEAVVAATGGARPDIVIDVTGVPSAFSEGVRLTRPGGRFVSVGNITVGKTCEFDPGLFTRSGVTIVPAIRYHPWFLGRALDFVARHPGYPWASLLDADYKLSEVDRALRDSADRTVTRASLVMADDLGDTPTPGAGS
jgi:threonine dehydrogenase-like Zn-dependent dehydrogenase